MLKGFNHLIDIEEDYIQILLADIKSLGCDTQQDIERFIFQNDTDLGKEERPIFREKIRLQITEIIENASFFERAIQGKSDKAIYIFKNVLYDEIKYRYQGGIALSWEDIEGFYNHLIEAVSTFEEESLFAYQHIYPDANTDMSEDVLMKRRYKGKELAECLPYAFANSEFAKKLKMEKVQSDIYHRMTGRIWSVAVSYFTIEKCMDLAAKNPPVPPEPPQKSKWNLLFQLFKIN